MQRGAPMWRNRKYKDKYQGRYAWVIDKKTSAVKRMFVLSNGADQEYFESWQDAKAANWRKCK